MKEINQTMKIPRKNLLWIILISLFGCTIYFQTYNYNYTADDGIYSYFNKATQQGLKGVDDLFAYGSMNFINTNPSNAATYRPFTLLTFALEKHIFGEFNPTNGHVFNIILYFFVLLVIGLLLSKIFTLKDIPIVIPLLILILYAVHPLHVEVVASIKSRDTLLSCLFAFTAIYYWLINSNKLTPWKKLITGFLFFIALLSKEESLTFIAVTFLISWYFLNINFTKSLKQSIPFIVTGGIYIIIRQVVLDSPTTDFNNILNNIIYITQGQERLATNLYIYLYYIKLLIFPHPLSWDYSFNQIAIKTMSNGWVLLSFIFFVGLAYFAIKGFRKKTVISFAILFYLSTFSIFSNFIPSITIGATMAERFMFIPSLGFFIILVYGLYLILLKFNVRKVLPSLLLIVLPFIIAYTVKSITRVPVWQDNLALFKSGINDSPKSWRTHLFFADELRQRAVNLSKDTLTVETSRDSSNLVFQKSVFHFKKSYSIIEGKAKGLYYLQALGECYLNLKDTAAAKEAFQKAVESPKLYFGLFHLGMISFNEKDYQSAIDYYQKALKANSPDFFSTNRNLALSYQMLNDYNNAIKFYEKALKYGKSDEINSSLSFCYLSIGNLEKAKSLNPKIKNVSEEEIIFLKSMTNGNVAYKSNNYVLARQYFEKCNSVFNKYGGATKYPEFLNAFAHTLLQTNDISRAKAIFKQVSDKNPKNYFALKNIGFISFQYEKKYEQAIQYYNQSLQANSPDYFQSYSNLGTLYLVKKQHDKAIENYELALKYGSSQTILNNLVLLWKSKGNQEKIAYYQALSK